MRLLHLLLTLSLFAPQFASNENVEQPSKAQNKENSGIEAGREEERQIIEVLEGMEPKFQALLDRTKSSFGKLRKGMKSKLDLLLEKLEVMSTKVNLIISFPIHTFQELSNIRPHGRKVNITACLKKCFSKLPKKLIWKGQENEKWKRKEGCRTKCSNSQNRKCRRIPRLVDGLLPPECQTKNLPLRKMCKKWIMSPDTMTKPECTNRCTLKNIKHHQSSFQLILPRPKSYKENQKAVERIDM